MSALDEAVRAEMQRQGCEMDDFHEPTACRSHGSVYHFVGDWDTERDECRVVATAVRAGWAAATAGALDALRETPQPDNVSEFLGIDYANPDFTMAYARNRVRHANHTTKEQQ